MYPEVECDPLSYYQKAINNGFFLRDKKVGIAEPFIMDRYWTWTDNTNGYVISFIDGLSGLTTGDTNPVVKRLSAGSGFFYFGALQLKLSQVNNPPNSGKRKPRIFKNNFVGYYPQNLQLSLAAGATQILYNPDNTVSSPASYAESWRFVGFDDIFTSMVTSTELLDFFAMSIHFSGVRVRIS